ncbi:urease accessory protein UreF [Amaricoccus solimangrovi]|uniref:Urease accessory protein UreF n=1 Tax=Amaricoccus solimangrovi TaxID=2589815 RepID=A0A501WU90_9RHOB|nr:urease accessory UreF family protein [Amaricoccus solimangrovi]TPE53303.1 urease accessory protein UreF [Amaricoccus solimangrovi]
MADPAPDATRALPDPAQILASWFSPAYPVGAYSYSHGLEWAVEAGEVMGRAGLADWVADLLRHGAGWSDAVLLAATFRAGDPAPLAALAEALAPSSERLLETMAQGGAFARTTAAVWGIALPPMAYPVAVGRAARLLGLPLRPALTLYLQGFAANIVSAGVRLVPLGQTDGQRITADLMPLCAELAARAEGASLDEIGGSALRADLAAMLHETQYTRLYRS